MLIAVAITKELLLILVLCLIFNGVVALIIPKRRE